MKQVKLFRCAHRPVYDSEVRHFVYRCTSLNLSVSRALRHSRYPKIPFLEGSFYGMIEDPFSRTMLDEQACQAFMDGLEESLLNEA